ncbi:hypothetical protein Gotur_029805 [Gossypium turneri]
MTTGSTESSLFYAQNRIESQDGIEGISTAEGRRVNNTHAWGLLVRTKVKPNLFWFPAIAFGAGECFCNQF